MPASFRAGNIEVAVFSSGEAPFFARWLRSRLEMELSRNLGTMGDLMAELRAEIKQLPVDQEQRARLLNSVLESDVLDILRDEGKQAALQRARALVAFPGGFGTLDELFEVLTLVQTRKAQKVPIVLFGSDYWRRLLNLQMLVDEGAIALEDLDLYQMADSPEDAWDIIRRFYGL